jgi:hypothetical protein
MQLGRFDDNPSVSKRGQETGRQVHPVGQLQQIVEKSGIFLIKVHMHVDNAAGGLVCAGRSLTRKEAPERRQFHDAAGTRHDGRPARSAEKSAT